MMLESFWKPKLKHKITFILKSGAKIRFDAGELIIRRDGNTLTGYEIKNSDNHPFYCCLNEIAAILSE